MSVRYGLQMLPVLDITSYPIWDRATIYLDLFGGTQRLEESKIVTWDAAYTTITSATLVVRGTVDSGLCNLRLLMNNRWLSSYGWVLPDVYTARIDVTGTLVNGPNTFEVIFNKMPLIPPVTLTFTATLEVEHTGDAPSVTPDYSKYLPYVAVGLVSIVGVAALIMWSRRRKPGG